MGPCRLAKCLHNISLSIGAVSPFHCFLDFDISVMVQNISPKCWRRLLYSTYLLPFGMKTTWYLHSHFEWLKLLYSSIQILLDVCLAAHLLELLGWTSENVKLLQPPRQGRGTPHWIRVPAAKNSGTKREASCRYQ